MSNGRSHLYVSEVVAGVLRLYPYLSELDFRKLPVVEQLDRQARTLLAAHAQGDRRVVFQLGSWWPGAAQKSADDLISVGLGMSDARLTLAREYGFPSWQAAQASPEARVDLRFEDGVDAVTAGDLKQLATLLDEAPELATQRSHYGHRSTLLHYIGANGVETWRQVTPLNAAAVAAMLIAHGADVSATADMYGGGQTALDLVTTSSHPAAAGVTDDIVAVLTRAS